MLCHIWARSSRWSCLVSWFCYQLIAKPSNKRATPPWPDPYQYNVWWCYCTRRQHHCILCPVFYALHIMPCSLCPAFDALHLRPVFYALYSQSPETIGGRSLGCLSSLTLLPCAPSSPWRGAAGGHWWMGVSCGILQGLLLGSGLQSSLARLDSRHFQKSQLAPKWIIWIYFMIYEWRYGLDIVLFIILLFLVYFQWLWFIYIMFVDDLAPYGIRPLPDIDGLVQERCNSSALAME